MADLLSILTMIAGILMSLSYYPQAYKILKKKSAKNISLLTYLFFSIGTVIWFIYGIVNKDLVIVSSFGVGTIGSNLVFFSSLYYKNKK